VQGLPSDTYYIGEMTVVVATCANAQILPPEKRGTLNPTVPRDPLQSMEDIAAGTRRVLNHTQNNGTQDRYVTGHIRAVRQYALNA
jgi:hypothetical protein